MVDPDSLPETRESQAPRRPIKSEGAFRTISEVSQDLEVPQHVLRFWESKFTQIKPLKRGGGRRYYRPEDVQLLSQIRDLLYKDGYTIRGVQKLLREPAAKGKGDEPAEPGDEREILHEMLAELRELKRILLEARRK
jgi:DNA-binding transcriptional MerR regulator